MGFQNNTVFAPNFILELQFQSLQLFFGGLDCFEESSDFCFRIVYQDFQDKPVMAVHLKRPPPDNAGRYSTSPKNNFRF
jgi:hypothetical protein